MTNENRSFLKDLKKRISFHSQFQYQKTLLTRYPYLGEIVSNLSPNMERRFHAYCVGLPRSGTHSIANILKPKYLSEHEPYARLIIQKLINKKEAPDNTIQHFLTRRDKLMLLEMEAAHYLHFYTKELVEIFPKSKFILTVREPVTWLESEINMNIKTYGSIWSRLEKFRYNDQKHVADYKNSIPLSVYKTYLNYYKQHINLVLNNTPKDRLLILDTFKISSNYHEICTFLNVPACDLDMSKSHSSKRKNKPFKLNNQPNYPDILKLVHEKCDNFINKNLKILSKYIN